MFWAREGLHWGGRVPWGLSHFSGGAVNKHQEKNASEIDMDHMDWGMQQTTVGRCAFCPEFFIEGTGAEVRQALADHRARWHPEAQQHTRRRRQKRGDGSLYPIKQALSEQELAELEDERQRRMRLLGI